MREPPRDMGWSLADVWIAIEPFVWERPNAWRYRPPGQQDIDELLDLLKPPAVKLFRKTIEVYYEAKFGLRCRLGNRPNSETVRAVQRLFLERWPRLICFAIEQLPNGEFALERNPTTLTPSGVMVFDNLDVELWQPGIPNPINGQRVMVRDPWIYPNTAFGHSRARSKEGIEAALARIEARHGIMDYDAAVRALMTELGINQTDARAALTGRRSRGRPRKIR